MKLIAFSGAQGTGKTTLLRKMKQDLSFIADPNKEYEFYDEITRKLKREGMSINEDANDYSQRIFINNMHVITKNLNSLCDPYARVFDRCFLDVYCYTTYLYNNRNVNEVTMEMAEDMLNDQKDKFDIIFYIKPEFELENNGLRSNSVTFRDEIADLFEYVIHEKNINVVNLSGSISERYEIIRDFLL